MSKPNIEEMAQTVLTWFAEAEPASQVEFQNSTKDGLIRYHHLLGRDIRNHFDLWESNWTPRIIDHVDTSEGHPDSVSMRVIEAVWEKLQ